MQEIIYQDNRKTSIPRKGIAMKATYEQIVSHDNVIKAIENMAKNKGSNTAGVDGKTVVDYSDKEEFAKEIQKRMKRYHPKAVKRVYIPKPHSDKMRPLGIPCYIDRVIQMAIKQVLEPICEEKFYDKSYGFRPNRSAENAIADIHKLVTLSKCYFVASVDIKGFFDNVNHEILYQQLKNIGITCKRTLALIKAILRAPISDDGKTIKSLKGTPQGGVISPLLSNVVLNDIDWLVDKQWRGRQYKSINKVTKRLSNNVRKNQDAKLALMRRDGISSKWIVRYADDFVLLSDTQEGIENLVSLIIRKLNKLGLEVSEEKTRMVDLKTHSIDFLGFKISTKFNGKAKNTRGEVVGYHVMQTSPSDKADTKAYRNIKTAWMNYDKYRNGQSFALLNSVIAGTQNYYRIATTISKHSARWEHRLWATMKRASTVKLKKGASAYPKELRQRYRGHNAGVFWTEYGYIFPIRTNYKKPMMYSQKAVDDRKKNKS